MYKSGKMFANLFSYVMSPPKWRKSTISPEPRLRIYDDLSDSDEEGNYRIDKDVNNNQIDNGDSFCEMELDELECKEIEMSVEKERLQRIKCLEKEIQEKVVKKTVEIMEKSIVKVKEKSNSKTWSFDTFNSSRRSTGRSESNLGNENDGTDKVENIILDTPSNNSQRNSPMTPSPSRSSFFSPRKATQKVATIPIDSAIFIARRYYRETLEEGYLKIDEEMKRECASRKIVALEKMRKSGNLVIKSRRSSEYDSDLEDDGKLIMKGEKERKLSIATAETAATIAEKLFEEARLPSIQQSDNNECGTMSKDGLDLDELKKDNAAARLELELDKIEEAHNETHTKTKQTRRKVSFSDEVEQGMIKREEIAALVQNHIFDAELSSDDEDDNSDDENKEMSTEDANDQKEIFVEESTKEGENIDDKDDDIRLASS